MSQPDYRVKVSCLYGTKKLLYRQLVTMWVDGKRVPGPIYIAGWEYHYEYLTGRWWVYPPN